MPHFFLILLCLFSVGRSFAGPDLLYRLIPTSSIQENCRNGSEFNRSRIKVGIADVNSNPRILTLSLRLCTAAADYRRADALWSLPASTMNPQVLLALRPGETFREGQVDVLRLPNLGSTAWFRLSFLKPILHSPLSLQDLRVGIPLTSAGQNQLWQLTGTDQAWSHFELTLRHLFLAQPLHLQGILDSLPGN